MKTEIFCNFNFFYLGNYCVANMSSFYCDNFGRIFEKCFPRNKILSLCFKLTDYVRGSVGQIVRLFDRLFEIAQLVDELFGQLKNSIIWHFVFYKIESPNLSSLPVILAVELNQNVERNQ